MADKRRLRHEGGGGRRLSLSKRRKMGGDGAKGSPSDSLGRVGAITSFFSNTPPPRLPCPICGELVHRFRINEHIDTNCQKFRQANAEESEVTKQESSQELGSGTSPSTQTGSSSTTSAEHSGAESMFTEVLTTSLPMKSSVCHTPDKQVGPESGEEITEKKVSPYFKQQHQYQEGEETRPWERAGKGHSENSVKENIEENLPQATGSSTSRCRSLASRLSRKVLTFTETPKSTSPSRVQQGDERIADLSSSQKENDVEVPGKPVCEPSGSTEQLPQMRPMSKLSKRARHDRDRGSTLTVSIPLLPLHQHMDPQDAGLSSGGSSTKSSHGGQQLYLQPHQQLSSVAEELQGSGLCEGMSKVEGTSTRQPSKESSPPVLGLHERRMVEKAKELQDAGLDRDDIQVGCSSTGQSPPQEQKATLELHVHDKQKSGNTEHQETEAHEKCFLLGMEYNQRPSAESEPETFPCKEQDLLKKVLDTPQLGTDKPDPDADPEAEVETTGTIQRPYYLRNFLSVLEAVLEHEDDRLLFNQEDMQAISSFQQLSDAAQCLYVRLFQRKLRWLQLERLDYARIATDLGPVVDELQQAGFLQGESELEDLSEALHILSAPDLRALAKTFHLKAGASSSAPSRAQLMEALLKLSRQRSLFAAAPGQNGTTGAVILKRARSLAGRCVRLRVCERAVFSRIMLLFSLPEGLEEETAPAAGTNTHLHTLLLVNSGQLAYPQYTLQRHASIFLHREHLIRYEVAMRSLQEVSVAMQSGNWEDALGLYNVAMETWKELQKSGDFKHEEFLPVFLRCFTVGWVYTRIRSRGVEILQRLKRYKEAVEELRALLLQSTYCSDSRGRWWDRLALNLQQHLKLHEQAINAIRQGLADPLVRTGHQLALQQRAARIRDSPSLKRLRPLLKDLPWVTVQDVPHVTIRGHMFPHQEGMGKSVFLRPMEEADGEVEGGATVMCSVEDLALAHYRQLGYDQGLHGEGSTFSTLCGLLLWDVIFMEGVPDAFRYPYQTCPLDLHTDCFYSNRRHAIEECVQLVRDATMATLEQLLADVWEGQQGRLCALVNWERFTSLQQAQSLVACLGGPLLSEIMLKMAKDYRHCRGGLPDLVVWNSNTHAYKLVEVKGPNDRLSQKQQLWLDELRGWGAEVEVCHVAAIGGRAKHLE